MPCKAEIFAKTTPVLCKQQCHAPSSPEPASLGFAVTELKSLGTRIGSLDSRLTISGQVPPSHFDGRAWWLQPPIDVKGLGHPATSRKREPNPCFSPLELVMSSTVDLEYNNFEVC